MNWGAFFYPHTVHVRDRIRSGGMGEGYSAAREVSAEVLDEQKIVRTTDGTEIVSSTQVTVPLDANVPIGSLVRVWKGQPGEREARVLAVAREPNAPPLDAHLILSLE